MTENTPLTEGEEYQPAGEDHLAERLDRPDLRVGAEG